MNNLKLLALFVSLFLLPQVSASAEPELFWSYGTGGTVTGVAVSNGGDYMAAASSDGYLYFLNDSKQLMWKVQMDDVPLKVAVSSDGNMTFVGDGSRVYLYNKTGDVQWEFFIGDETVDIAVTPKGGRIAVGSIDRNVYLFNDVGGILWKYRTNAPVLSIDISGDGKYIAAGTSGGITYMLDRDGNLLWEYVSRKSTEGVGILGEGVVSGERFLDFLEDGNKVGTYSNIVCDMEGISSTSDGHYILVGCQDGNIYMMDDSRKKRWSYGVGAPSFDSSVSAKGDYFAAAVGKSIYVFKAPDIVPPIVEITKPAQGDSISGIVDINASIVEDSSYTLRILIDADFACSNLPCSWNTGASTEGKHNITVEVNDSGGNVGTDTVDVTLKHSVITGITNEISEKGEEIIEEKQGIIKEKEEALKEEIDEKLPIDITDLPPIREQRDYGTVVKWALVVLSVYIVLKFLVPKAPKKQSRGKYKFRR